MAGTRRLSAAEVLAVLAEGPGRIADAVAGVPEDRLRARPTPDEWSAAEVLVHLRSCADVWGGCIETILGEDRPTIRAVNPRTWAERAGYGEEGFADALRAFTTRRDALLGLLRGLTPEQWERAATVVGAGKPLTRTVHDYAQWLATHERPHVRQIARAVTA